MVKRTEEIKEIRKKHFEAYKSLSDADVLKFEKIRSLLKRTK